MTIRIARQVEQPYFGQPGRCSVCGAEVRPSSAVVAVNGVWDGRHPEAGRRAGGPSFETNCPACGVVLHTLLRCDWGQADSGAVARFTSGDRLLVGGDRWRGRPGGFAPADEPRYEARLRELRERVGSLDGGGPRPAHDSRARGCPARRAVERVAGLPPPDAKRLVVTALAFDWGDG